MDLIDRFRGSILGLAVGDALGHPTEFISSVARIRERYGARGIVDFDGAGRHPPGTFTDDTQMAICVARALIRAGRAPLDALMTLLGQEFVAWASHPTNDRAPGGTCLTGCRKLRAGAAWRDAGVKESKGCGAAMRAAPIGLYFYDDDEALVRVAAAQSVLTHSHPTGIASSVAAAAPVAWAARGNGIAGMIEHTVAMVEKLTPTMLRELGARPADVDAIGIGEQLRILERTQAAIARDEDDVCKLLGGAWIGEEAVACALWCVMKAGGDVDEAIWRGANSSGDSDSIACIAGSIAGAHGGVASIRPAHLEQLERTADLDALARLLWAARDSADVPATGPGLDFFGAERGAARAPTKADGDDTEDQDEGGGDVGPGTDLGDAAADAETDAETDEWDDDDAPDDGGQLKLL